MTKTATLKFNDRSSKWEASFGGHVFLKSASKDYVVDKIVNQISAKAQQLGVTAVEEIGAETQAFPAAKSSDPDMFFGINERFQIMEDFVDMVATRTTPSSIVTGEGGLGKTHTVMKALRKAGLKDISEMDIGAGLDPEASRKAYIVVKGFSTAKGLFRTLYENRNKIVVFDDCDSVMKDPVAANLLKGALDSYDKRTITWNAESFGGDDDLPKSFEFTGGVIFISNMPMYKIPQALISRSLPADVSMTRPEIIERMAAIVAEGDFLADFEMSHKTDALAFIAKHANNPAVKSLNLRTLILATKARATKPEHWERLSLYAMINA